MAVDANDAFPYTAMAANNGEDSLCCVECEKFILEQRNISYLEDEIMINALENKWLKESGTPLYNVGRHLEQKGLVVTRKFHSTLDEIANLLAQGAHLIAAVDGGELDAGKYAEEKMEDMVYKHSPDHTIVILSYNREYKSFNIFNPDSIESVQTIPQEIFLDAWNDSDNFLVAASAPGELEYVPAPLDLSGVELEGELEELREALAENAHEVWAYNRKKEGWSYGSERDDALKQTPDMVPYSQLSDSEKQYDREMAVNTIKLLKKLGYELVKR